MQSRGNVKGGETGVAPAASMNEINKEMNDEGMQKRRAELAVDGEVAVAKEGLA